MERYHLRRKDLEITDQSTIEGILKQGKYAVLGLCRGDEPYVVTLSYGYDADQRALFFHCAHEGQKIEFIRANPRCCATIILDQGYEQGQCSHHFQSLIIRGTVSVVTSADEKRQAMMTMLRHLEDDPSPVAERSLVKTDRLPTVTILRLDIQELTAKKSD